MNEEIDKLSKGIGKAVETVPELYHDALQPSAQEAGKLIARIPRAINAIFAGLDKWILRREFGVEETKKLLAVKLDKTDPEKIVEPEPYVAIPAIQAISYAMNSNELRNMYANLLAKSMIIDTKDTVHPSFVEIIKQMSPIDARIFQLIMESQLRPIINLKKQLESGGGLLIQSHCSWIKTFSIKQCATSIDNLLRLGLIEIPYGDSYSNAEVYDYVKQNPLFKELEEQSKISLASGESLDYDTQYIKTSDLSTLFYNVCVLNP